MPSLQIIYDNALKPLDTNDSTTFRNGRFIYFTVSSLAEGQEMEVSISCLINLPTISGIVSKLWSDIGSVLTDSLVPLPSEISDMPYDFYLSFGVGDNVQGFRAYVITSTDTLESLAGSLEDIKAQLDSIEVGDSLQETITNTITTTITNLLLPVPVSLPFLASASSTSISTLPPFLF